MKKLLKFTATCDNEGDCASTFEADGINYHAKIYFIDQNIAMLQQIKTGILSKQATELFDEEAEADFKMDKPS